MTKSERIQRMNALLDGEATPDEAREIEALIERDPQARAEFEGLKVLFAALESVPQAHAPEGLVAAVTARYAQRDQLSSDDGVIRDTGIADRRRSPERSNRRPPAPGAAPIHGGGTMITSKRRLWIGGIAVALVAVAFSSRFIEFPSSGDGTVGTITPAQRYRAPQATPGDIKLADPTTPAGGQVAPITTPPTGAAQNAAENAAQGFAKDSAQGYAKDSAQGYAKDSAQGYAKDSAQGYAKDSAQG